MGCGNLYTVAGYRARARRYRLVRLRRPPRGTVVATRASAWLATRSSLCTEASPGVVKRRQAQHLASPSRSAQAALMSPTAYATTLLYL